MAGARALRVLITGAAGNLGGLLARRLLPRSPLTRDFVRIGRVPYWGDTSRMRRELLPQLAHPTLASGLRTLAGP